MVSVSLYVIIANAESADADVPNPSGKCGDDLGYEFDATSGTLTFTGSGQMYQYSMGVAPWYQYKNSIRTICIGDSITYIGYSAFFGCASVTSVTFPSSLTSIGNYAFYGCTSLTSVSFPSSLTSIGNYAFYGCTSLASASFSNSLSSIGNYAFYNCTALTSVTLSTPLTSIGNFAFYNCSSITSLTIPDSITFIGTSAFYNCRSLQFLSIPASFDCVSSKENPIFTGCDKIEKVIFTGSGEWYPLYSFYEYAPWQLSKSTLTTVIVSSGVTSVGNYVFSDCTSLSSVTLSDSIKYIRGDSFYNCVKLTSLSIPKSVKEIEDCALLGCTSLESIDVSEDCAYYSSTGGVLLNKAQTILLLYPQCKSDASFEIPNTVTTIETSAFKYCTFLNSVTLPDSLKKIKWGAFEGCNSLVSITLPKNVELLENKAFYGCSSLTSVTFGRSLSTIGPFAFCGCSSLTSITFGKSVATIGSWAFQGCSSLTSLIFPESLTSIREVAFSGCSSLDTLIFSKSIGMIGPSVFDDKFYDRYGITELEPSAYNLAGFTYHKLGDKWIKEDQDICGSGVGYEFNATTGILSISGSGPMFNYSNGTAPWYPYKNTIKTIIVGDSITSIGNYAFSDCIDLTSLTLSETITAIGESAFNNCTSLKSIELPGSIRTIGVSAFRGCTSFTSITLPDSVRTLGSSLFKGCTNLTSVTMSPSVTSIGENAFCDCGSLTSIIIPDTVTSIGENAFEGCTRLASIDVGENNSYFSSTEGVLFNKSGTTLIQYPVGKTDSSYEIPNTVTSIAASAFNGCTDLTSIILPASVTTIGSFAFYDCPNLLSVSFPDSITAIGKSAFSGSFYDTDGVTKLGSTAADLIGSTFKNNGEKWIKQSSSEDDSTISGMCGKNVKYTFDAITGKLIISGSGPMDDYTTRDKPFWDSYKDQIQSVSIGGDVTSVGDYAFSSCSSLKSVTLSNKVSSIGTYTFDKCISLSSITITGSVTSIGDYAFYGCSSLTSIFLPDSVTYLGESTFRECSKLTSVTLSSSVTELKSSVFLDCESLTSVVIPNSVTSIREYAFVGCKSLASITFPQLIIKLGKNVFNGTFYDTDGETEFKQAVDLAGFTFKNVEGKWIKQSSSYSGGTHNMYSGYCGKNARYVFDVDSGTLSIRGSGAMFDYADSTTPWYLFKKSITSVVIEEPVTSIGDYAFFACSKVLTITIPYSITSIGDFAFNSCSSLTTISIPISVTSIGKSVFNGTFYDLKGTTILPQNALYLSGYTYINTDGKWIKQPPTPTEQKYEKRFGLCGNDVIYKFDATNGRLTISGSGPMYDYGEGTTPWYSFRDSIKSAVIEDSVTSIGAFAFCRCSITFVVIPDSVTSLGESAFSHSTLDHVTIPDSVTFIGQSVFFECTSLIYVVIKDSLTFINNFAFKDCTSLRSLIIPSSVTSIGISSFRGCTSLISLTIPDSVTSIGDFAFKDCASIATLSIPKSVISIGENVFYGTFYEADRETELAPTVENLTGFTFNNVDGKWIKQASSSDGDSSDPSENKITYVFDPATGTLTICGSGPMDNYSNGTSLWDSNKGSITSVIIGDSVTSIGTYAFNGCTSLTSVTIGKSVTSIGDSAFRDCILLSSLTIPESVTSIGASAFYGCAHLRSITIPDTILTLRSFIFCDCTSLTSISIPDSVETIGSSAFSGCTALSSIIIPDSVETIGSSAFSGCTALSSITISDSVLSIGYSAFYNCTSLTSISIPNSVKTIGSYAFSDCTSLTTISISDSVKTIGESAFECCTSLASVTLSNSITCISDSVFSDCTSLASITLPDSLITIRGSAFYNCTSLTSITIPDSVTSIWYSAFNSCSNLTSINISESVRYLGALVFKGCTSLASIDVSEKNMNYCSVDGVLFSKDRTTLILYPMGKTDSSFKVPASVTTIEDNAFYGIFYETDGITELEPTAVNLAGSTFSNVDGNWIKQAPSPSDEDSPMYFGQCGDNITYEFDSATGTLEINGFGSMYDYSTDTLPWKLYKDSIKSVIIGYSITTIGDYAFIDCTNLNSVTVPDSVTKIGKFAFTYCKSITSFNIPGSVTSIGDYAFKGCISLTSIIMPDSVTYLGEASFQHCYSLKSAIISDSLTILRSSTFGGCTSLSTIRIPDSVTTIYYAAFGGCTSLTSVVFSDSVTSIEYSAFYECTSLISVVFPNSVTTIGNFAFYGCYSLTTITLSNSLSSIGENAFYGKFYDADGETTFAVTATNLAGSTFNYVDGKWIKQGSTPTEDPNKVSGECGNGVTYELELSSGTLTISGSGEMVSYSSGEAPWYSYRDSIESIEIADTITSIGDYAFEGITSIESIIIPDSLESLGASAFAGCTKLSTVTLGRSVNTLGEGVFKGCTSLALYVVSENNCTYASIEGVLFSKDKILLIQYPVAKVGTSYEIPASVKTIASSAFKGCTSLTTITIPGSVTTIEDGAFDMVFYDPEGENELESTVENLAGSTFNKVDGKWIKQKPTPSEDPNKVSGECGDKVTYELDKTSGILTINGSGKLESYSSGEAPWYSYKDSISSIVIGDNITSIGNFAFEGITTIESIIIPDSVESIGASAFADCTKLATVNLGKSVNSLGEGVFNGCTSLALYVVSENNGTYASIEGVLFSSDKSTLIQYPVAKADASYEIPAAVTTIASYAFKGCTSLTFITIPDSVETLEAGAFDMVFYDPEGEKELEPSVENLVGSTFNKVDGKWVKQASAPTEDPNKESGECGDSVTYELDLSTGTLTINGSGMMGSYPSGQAPWYAHKDSIRSIEIADTVTSIGDFAFEGITSIESTTIPDLVESIGASAFAGCSKLTAVNFGNSVSSINESAFKDCTSLTSYLVSENNGIYASIDGVLFSKDKLILIQYPVAKAGTSYEIPDNVKTIASSAFNGCTPLTSITIPDSVTTIEADAFDAIFYDPEGETELDQTVENLAGSTFNNVDGKWTKQASTPSEDPSKDPVKCGDNTTFEFDTVTGTLMICGSGAMYDYVDGTTPWDSFKGAIRSVVVDDSVTSIGTFAFSNCTSLITVTIPDSITSIGASAFKNCSGMKELIVPASLDTVRSNEHPIFEGCVNIEKFTFAAGDGTWYNYDTGSSQSISLRYTSRVLNDNILKQSSELPNYKYTPWQLSRSTLTSVVISEGVTSIGDSAFKGCTSLTSITIPDSVGSIGRSVFSGCDSLTTFNVSEVSSKYCILGGVLYNKEMTELIQYPAGNINTSFEIPDGIKSIADSAFKDCTYLTSITIPNSVTSIADSAFSGKFYDSDGASEISHSVADIAGSTFEKIDGNWVKQSSAPLPTPSPSPSDTNSCNRSMMIYLFIAIVVVLAIFAVAVVVKKKHV